MNEERYVKELNELIPPLKHQHGVEYISNANQNFYADLGFDSLSIMELALSCEDKYKIKMEDKIIIKIEFVKDLINIIDEKLNNKTKNE